MGVDLLMLRKRGSKLRSVQECEMKSSIFVDAQKMRFKEYETSKKEQFLLPWNKTRLHVKNGPKMRNAPWNSFLTPHKTFL